jgi:hypothetical protein
MSSGWSHVAFHLPDVAAHHLLAAAAEQRLDADALPGAQRVAVLHAPAAVLEADRVEGEHPGGGGAPAHRHLRLAQVRIELDQLGAVHLDRAFDRQPHRVHG